METNPSVLQLMLRAYDIGKQIWPDYSNAASRHDFTQPQLFACLAVREALKLSYRRAEAFLQDVPDWLAKIELCNIPDHNTLWRAFGNLLNKRRINKALDLRPSDPSSGLDPRQVRKGNVMLQRFFDKIKTTKRISKPAKRSGTFQMLDPLESRTMMSSSTEIYLKLPGVHGGVTQPGYAGDIQVFSFSFATSGSGKNVSISKTIDRTTPKLFQDCATGKILPSAALYVVDSHSGKAYLRYQFSDVVISSDRKTENLADPGNPQNEWLEFHAASATSQFTPPDALAPVAKPVSETTTYTPPNSTSLVNNTINSLRSKTLSFL